MKSLNLGHGTGDGIETACLVTAASMLVGEPEQLDKPECVCPVIRAFAIPTNDAMPLELLGELYGSLVPEIVGTRNTPDVMRDRAFLAADWAIRDVLPRCLPPGDAKKLILHESLINAFTARETADVAERIWAAAETARVSEVVCLTTVTAAKTVRAETPADEALKVILGETTKPTTVSETAYAAKLATVMSILLTARIQGEEMKERQAIQVASLAAKMVKSVSRVVSSWDMCPELIRAMANIGKRDTIKAEMTLEQLHAALDVSA